MLLFAALAPLPPALATVREPRVDIKCPALPSLVNAESKSVLVYELHITSFESVPLLLKSVRISGDAAGSAPLAAFSGHALSPITDSVGPASNSDAGKIVAPGQRAIIFLWLEINRAGTAPHKLVHRFDFVRQFGSATKPDEEASLQNFVVPVRPESPLLLTSPFNGGTWLAGSGPSNTSDHRRTIVALDGGAYIAQRFAIDWVKIGANNDTTHDGNARNENYWGYGEPVHAVADGETTEVVNDIPDNVPHKLPDEVTLRNIAGNHVIVRVSPNLFVTFAHLQPGSIKVRVGDRVRRGDVIGLLGNSGNTSGPHLHLQVSNANSVLGSEGVPFIFENYQYLGSGADYPEKQVSEPRSHSLPVENSVIRFSPLKN